MIYGVLAATVLLITVVAAATVKRNKKLMGEGKIIQRQQSFWENAELFSTWLSYEQLRQAVLATDFSECGVTVTPDLEGKASILFRSRHGFNAVLNLQSQQGEWKLFRFYFPAWKTTRYGTPTGFTQMNMLETAIERLFLAMDPDTAVETRKLQTKTKTRFF